MLKISAKIPFFFLTQGIIETGPQHPYWHLLSPTEIENIEKTKEQFLEFKNKLPFSSKNNSIDFSNHPDSQVTAQHIEDLTQMANNGHEIAARIVQYLSPERFQQLAISPAMRESLAHPHLSLPVTSKEREELYSLLEAWINEPNLSNIQKQVRTTIYESLRLYYDICATSVVLNVRVSDLDLDFLPPGLHLLENVKHLDLCANNSTVIPAHFTLPPKLKKLTAKESLVEMLRPLFPKTLKTINGIPLELQEQLFTWANEDNSEDIKRERSTLYQKILRQPQELEFDAIKLGGIPPKMELMTSCRDLTLNNCNLSLIVTLPPQLNFLRLVNCTSTLSQEIISENLVPFLELQEQLFTWANEDTSEDIKSERNKQRKKILRPTQWLDFDSKALRGIPPKMDLMTRCQHLTLENCNLSLLATLPPQLTLLRLVNCSSTLSQEIIPKNLLGLNLRRNPSLDINIYELAELKELSLKNTTPSIIKLDERIGNLTKLHRLSLGDSEFELLSESMLDTLNSLPKLSDLRLNIPDPVPEFPSLPPINPSLYNFPLSIDEILRTSSTFQPIYLPRNFPAINKLKQIESLTIRYNFEFPSAFLDSLKDMPALTNLDLSRCDKIGPSLAEVGALTQLRTLDLHGGRLTAIPDELANLSRACTINVEGNPLSLEEIERFRALCTAKRQQDLTRGPTLQFSVDDEDSDEEEQSLEDVTTSWQKQCRKFLPAHWQQHPFLLSSVADCIADFKDGEKKAWSDFLVKLKNSSDYKSEMLRPGILLRVAHMFQGARINAKFRGIILSLLKNSVNRCHDKPVQALNQIEILWRIHCEAKELDSPGVARLVIGLYRLDLLHTKARERIKELHLGDEVETFLRYETALREKLDLPVSIESMLHERASGIDEATLEKDGEEILAVSSTIDDRLHILLNSGIWRKHLKQDPVYQQKKAEIIERAQRALDKLADDGTYYANSKAVQEKQKKALQELTQEMTKAWLEKESTGKAL